MELRSVVKDLASGPRFISGIQRQALIEEAVNLNFCSLARYIAPKSALTRL
jgi:hypothetical protein